MEKDISKFDPTSGIIVQTPAQLVYEELSSDIRRRVEYRGVGEGAVFSISCENLLGVDQLVEVFGANNSIEKFRNDIEYRDSVFFTTGNPVRPFTSASFIAMLAKLASDKDPPQIFTLEKNAFIPRMVIFSDRTGDLNWYRNQVTLETIGITGIDRQATARVRCTQRPYKNFLADSMDLVMKVNKIKVTDSLNQFRTLLKFRRIMSFGGDQYNDISLSEFVDPENGTGKVIDIVDKPVYIDCDTTMFVPLLPNQKLNFTFFVEMYSNNGEFI